MHDAFLAERPRGTEARPRRGRCDSWTRPNPTHGSTQPMDNSGRWTLETGRCMVACSRQSRRFRSWRRYRSNVGHLSPSHTSAPSDLNLTLCAVGWRNGVGGFDSRPFHFQVTTLGKLFTQMCHCHQAVYHGLRGSASPVLTATGFVNGRWQFSTPHRIHTP